MLDALPSPPKRISLSGIGEPLMNPDFFALVDILAERAITCEFVTNGTLLTARMRGAILAHPNIEQICLSCDGSEAATFEKLRVGANFGKWKQLVEAFVAEARERRGNALRIVANVVVSKHNADEVREIVQLAARMGFDAINVMEPVPVDEVASALCPSPEQMRSICESDLIQLGVLSRILVNCGFRRTKLPPSSMMRCIQPWEYAFIRVNGDVTPCCALFGSQQAAIMGNVLHQGFADIWNGERFRAFRRTSAAGTNSLCRTCPYY
jgi:pyrroloquinoline quinone biosynthesis protein E